MTSCLPRVGAIWGMAPPACRECDLCDENWRISAKNTNEGIFLLCKNIEGNSPRPCKTSIAIHQPCCLVCADARLRQDCNDSSMKRMSIVSRHDPISIMLTDLHSTKFEVACQLRVFQALGFECTRKPPQGLGKSCEHLHVRCIGLQTQKAASTNMPIALFASNWAMDPNRSRQTKLFNHV